MRPEGLAKSADFVYDPDSSEPLMAPCSISSLSTTTAPRPRPLPRPAPAGHPYVFGSLEQTVVDANQEKEANLRREALGSEGSSVEYAIG